MQNARVLIVEDDADIREGVRILLESEGYAVTQAQDGTEGLQLFDDSFSLVILDVMMPGISGLKTCEEIRKQSFVPVLFLTAKSTESDKLIGLMAGGDDYLIKPFSYAELLGRVRAMLRRYYVYNEKNIDKHPESDDPVICIGGVELHERFNEVVVDGKEVSLTDIEYRILLLLMRYPNKTFSAQNIYESVWEEAYYYSANGTVMVHIRNLRMKIEKSPESPVHIKTVWGKGYRFE